MHRIYTLLLVIIIVSFSSCTVKESIVFNEDGSGNFLVNYDMASVMSQMKDAFSEGGDSTSTNEKKPSKVVDTLMVFSEIMETYKDSISALPKEKRLALEVVKDMYMKMKMDEANNVFDFGVGLNFNAIEDLKDIQKRIEKAKTLNSQNSQVDAMKEGSPLGKFMVNGENDVDYNFTENGFSRVTTVSEEKTAKAFKLDENSEEDKQFLDYFKNSFYIVEYTFSKKIKSTSIENAQLSTDKKTVTYKYSWIDFLSNPKLLDINIEFENE
ncbi:hypothetical protein [Jejuia spongiicola]|uniref:Lipoprotein n=1 Tax=Jejuia spongiicola TaxID=2942207 RepID=A0ABT0QFK6_9FLAO|nr:hypothetical protein [Jejuia spongiicola]MCL6295781.1 hypothetical protein [Jejuia spongiicola]